MKSGLEDVGSVEGADVPENTEDMGEEIETLVETEVGRKEALIAMAKQNATLMEALKKLTAKVNALAKGKQEESSEPKTEEGSGGAGRQARIGSPRKTIHLTNRLKIYKLSLMRLQNLER